MSSPHPPSSIARALPAEGAGGEAVDPVTEAALSASTSRRRPLTSLRVALAEARDLLTQARNDGGYRASLPRVLDLVRQHPEAEALQNTAARLMMEDGDAAGALAAWRGVYQRFPGSVEPFRMMVRMTFRQRGEAEARALLDSRIPDPHGVRGENDLLALAFGLEELGDAGKAEEAFHNATRLIPESRTAWRNLIRLQEARGGLVSAQHTAAMAMAGCGGDDFQQAHARLSRDLQILESLSPASTALDDAPYSVKALEAILGNVLASRRVRAFSPRRHLGTTLMVTGSLGSGGAERQLVTTALSLNAAARDGRMIEGYDVAGPVAVACRSLAAKTGNDFFLNTLDKAGVCVTEYGRLAPFGGQPRLSRASRFGPALDFLPARMKEGVAQLVDFLRHEAPDIVHIWQDGMVFAAGLAALMADVPRIVLSVRTLPPTDRVNRWRLELEPLYRALLASPGVVMTANSTLAAQRYEDWLELPRGSVPVIHNGVARLDESPGVGDEGLWAAFERRTAGADFTVGAVMRLDHNKRPLDWLLVAEKLHQHHPATRFIIVGDGALRQESQEYAHRLGIADRVLFTGLSSSVGYWLARMDTLMLLSRFEGMPNVLIEAQLAGMPVVTTPAGGAAETIQVGRTGWLLSTAESIDIDEAAQVLLQLATMDRRRRALVGDAAQSWAERAFSVDTMLERTVRIFMAPYDAPLLNGARPA